MSNVQGELDIAGPEAEPSAPFHDAEVVKVQLDSNNYDLSTAARSVN